MSNLTIEQMREKAKKNKFWDFEVGQKVTIVFPEYEGLEAKVISMAKSGYSTITTKVLTGMKDSATWGEPSSLYIHPVPEIAFGTKRWIKSNGQLHREDGPAIEYDNGNKSWYINGKLHREDGPAIELVNCSSIWYINGKNMSESEWKRQINETTNFSVGDRIFFTDYPLTHGTVREVLQNDKLTVTWDKWPAADYIPYNSANLTRLLTKNSEFSVGDRVEYSKDKRLDFFRPLTGYGTVIRIISPDKTSIKWDNQKHESSQFNWSITKVGKVYVPLPIGKKGVPLAIANKIIIAKKAKSKPKKEAKSLIMNQYRINKGRLGGRTLIPSRESKCGEFKFFEHNDSSIRVHNKHLTEISEENFINTTKKGVDKAMSELRATAFGYVDSESIKRITALRIALLSRTDTNVAEVHAIKQGTGLDKSPAKPYNFVWDIAVFAMICVGIVSLFACLIAA